MASFELIGYVKSTMFTGGRTRLTVAEYVQGKRNSDGEIENEKMDLWHIFFPPTSRKHLLRFKPHDLVIVKATIHQAQSDKSNYAYAVNGESIKHFYTRDLIDEIKREQNTSDEAPDLENYMNEDF